MTFCLDIRWRGIRLIFIHNYYINLTTNMWRTRFCCILKDVRQTLSISAPLIVVMFDVCYSERLSLTNTEITARCIVVKLCDLCRENFQLILFLRHRKSHQSLFFSTFHYTHHTLVSCEIYSRINMIDVNLRHDEYAPWKCFGTRIDLFLEKPQKLFYII